MTSFKDSIEAFTKIASMVISNFLCEANILKMAIKPNAAGDFCLSVQSTVTVKPHCY